MCQVLYNGNLLIPNNEIRLPNPSGWEILAGVASRPDKKTQPACVHRPLHNRFVCKYCRRRHQQMRDTFVLSLCGEKSHLGRKERFEMFSKTWVLQIRGDPFITFAPRGGRGVRKVANCANDSTDRLRENANEGGEGAQNPENFANVINGCPLNDVSRALTPPSIKALHDPFTLLLGNFPLCFLCSLSILSNIPNRG